MLSAGQDTQSFLCLPKTTTIVSHTTMLLCTLCLENALLQEINVLHSSAVFVCGLAALGCDRVLRTNSSTCQGYDGISVSVDIQIYVATQNQISLRKSWPVWRGL